MIRDRSRCEVGIGRGKHAARVGILTNSALAVFKLLAGVVGHSYALIADAIESSADIVSSAVVFGGLQVAGREADEQFPFGYGKAETLAGAVVALMLLGAAAGIAVEAVREIRVPHHAPASWTLVVLVAVVAVKWTLSRWVRKVATEIGSTAVRSDAGHHLSDALTSVAAFVGILIAVIGGPGWESADDWAALGASSVIAVNGLLLLRPAVADPMDRARSRRPLDNPHNGHLCAGCPRRRKVGRAADGRLVSRGGSRPSRSRSAAPALSCARRRRRAGDSLSRSAGAVGGGAHGTIRATAGMHAGLPCVAMATGRLSPRALFDLDAIAGFPHVKHRPRPGRRPVDHAAVSKAELRSMPGTDDRPFFQGPLG